MTNIKVWVARKPDGTFVHSDDDWEACWNKIFDRHGGCADHTAKAYTRPGWTVESHNLTKDETP
jgi:hypothetical protein